MNQLIYLLVIPFLTVCGRHYLSQSNTRVGDEFEETKYFLPDSSINEKDDSLKVNLKTESSLISIGSRKLQSTFVGSFNAYGGPSVGAVTYTCQQACALNFGGVAASYYGSISSTTVTRTCYTRTYGPCDQTLTSTDTYTNCATFSSPGCVSAYLNDGCGAATNYCFSSTTYMPSLSPTRSPTKSPSFLPTYSPSRNPTFTPTYAPTCSPSFLPTYQPSLVPTFAPTMPPSFMPTYSPSFAPTFPPSYTPSYAPSFPPTLAPTIAPSFAPTFNPSFAPSYCPTLSPSRNPSYTPTAFPSFTPTMVPSVAPTTIPSFNPSYFPTPKPSFSPSFTPTMLPTSKPSSQPSSQPLSYPTVQPISHPSRKPSLQPSKQPTNQPLDHPSVRPSLQPTEQPSTRPIKSPSRQPSSSPTKNPSSQPINHPTHMPSYYPTMMPSTVPSRQPFSQPTRKPSRNPTYFPSSTPSFDPSLRPTRCPSLKPSSIPKSGPSSQPTSKPSLKPELQPSKQPIENPSEKPTIHPSRMPNKIPTSEPSSQPSHTPSYQKILYPTSCPSMRPSENPSTRPSQQPSIQPKIQPTCQPTSQPTSRPTRKPISQPTSKPSKQPISHPSSIPSAQPRSHPTKMPVTSHPSIVVKGVRKMPTSHPTLSMDTLWTNKLAALLSVVSSITGTSVAHMSTYFELDNLNSPMNKHVSSTSFWSSFINDLKVSSYVYNPSSIQLTIQSDLDVDAATDYSGLTMSCQDSKNITKIINYLTGVSNTNIPLQVECAGYTWVARYCSSTSASLSELPAVCIGYVNPCSARARCLGGQIETKCTFAPSVSKSCGISIQNPIIRLMSVQFSDIQAAPSINRISSSVSKYSMSITATLSSQGLLYCAAYNRLSAGPQTIVELVLKNFMAKTNKLNSTTVEITGLNAVTTYTVYCLTESPLGTRLSLDKVRQSAVNVTTGCCNTITVQISASSVTAGQTNANFLSLVLNSSPSKPLLISVNAFLRSGVGNGGMMSSFAPSTFSLSSVSIVGINSPMKTQLLGSLVPGPYSIQVTLSGDSRNEYEVVYYNNASRFDVLEKNSPLPAPKIVNAIFADTGSYFTVKFDSASNKAAMKSNSFVCSALFKFACSQSSTCQWIDSATVNVYVYSQAMQNCSVPGSNLNLSSNAVIKAKCSLVNNICPYYDTWPMTALRSPLKISFPVSPVTPLVTISSPSTIGNCDSLTIDVSTSTGSGGREWRNKTISVQNDGKANVTAISNFLNRVVFTVSPPITIPASLFTGGQTYYFIVTLCNFLGKCSQAKNRVTVLTNPVPSVNIPGPAMRSVSRGLPLSIKSYASVQTCGTPTASKSGLDFSWSVQQNNVPLINLISRSVNPTVLTIPAFSLSVGRLYNIQLTVTMSSTLQSSTASVQVYVQSGNLIPRIAGSAVRNIRFGDSLQLDGSLSFDEDTNSAVGLTYSWSCVELSPEFVGNCSKLFQLQSSGVWNQPSLSLVSKKLPYMASNSSFTVKVMMSIYNADRSAQSSVTVNLISPITPLLINVNSNMPQGSMNGGDKLLLSGTVTLPFGATGTCSWSVDDGSFNLQSSSQSPLSFPLRSSGLNPLSVCMALAANSVPTGASLTFSLTCEVPSSSSSRATASINIVVNSPPQPGNFYVKPNTGVELSQKFTFIAENWQSVNLPISYQFGYVSSTNLNIVLRSISEMTYASFALPAGEPLQCLAQIYDSVNANATAVFSVRVTRSDTNATFIHQYLTAGLLSSSKSFNIDTIKQIGSLASGTMNIVDCSLTPNCSSLNRLGCFKSSHTCSVCYSGYIGTDGDSNEPCFLKINNRRLCTVNADCSMGSSHVCSDGVCQSSLSDQKTCLGNCSNNGYCQFVNVDSGVLVSQCLITDNSCKAVCNCHHDYFGSDYCDIKSSDMLVKQLSRSLVIKSIFSLTRLEDVNLNSLTSWINVLLEALHHPTEVAVSEIDSLLDLVSFLLDLADSVNLPFVTVSSVLTAVDSLATTISNNFEKSSNITKLEHVLQKYTTLVTKEMVAGQSAIQSINNQFRLKSVVLSSSEFGNSSSNSSLLSLPMTSYEAYVNRLSSSVSLPVALQDTNSPPSTVSLISLKSKLYNSSGTLISNPITLRMSNLPCQQSSHNCEVLVVLQNSLRLSFSPDNSSMETLVLKCNKGLHNTINRTCSTGHTVNMTCDGKRSGILRYTCPIKYFIPSCVSLSGSKSGYSDCKMVSYTSTNVTCLCKLSSSSHRLLMNSTDYQLSEYQFDYMSLLETTESSFVSTFQSTVDLSVDTISKGWKVLVTIGSFVFALIAAMVFAYYTDKRDIEKRVSVRPNQSIKDKESTILSVINKSSKAFTEITSTKKSKKKRKSNTISEKTTGINNQLLSIEEYLPMVLSSQSISAKVSNEVKHHHRWFSVIFHYSEHFSRLFRVISLTTSVIIMLFMQSLTYNLTNPDDGSCKQMTTKTTCLSATSPYATGEPKCLWTVTVDNSSGTNNGSCSFIEPDSSIKIILFVAIFSAIISTPIAILSDVIMQYILSAPVASYKENKGPSTVKGKWMRAFAGSKGKINDVVSRLEESCQTEINALTNDLQVYREELTESDRSEFDMVWGLDSDGKFTTEKRKNSLSQYVYNLLGLKTDAVSVYKAILNDLQKVNASVDLELEKSVFLTDGEKGRALMHLFQCDLLPGISGKILETKGKRDRTKASHVSPWVKFIGWGFILLLNSTMLFYIFLFAMNQTSTRQEAWFRSFIVWLVLDILFISTASVVFTHIFVPSMIMKDVTKIKQRMMENVSSFQNNLQQRLKNNPKKLEKKELVLDILKEKAKQFNAASYLFVSSRLAAKCLYLKEAQLIFNFATPWPRQSYQHVHDVSKSYNMKLSALQRSVSIIIFFFINGLMTAPISVQDIIIQIGSTGALGYGILIHIELFNISPLLVLFPFFICCLIAHFIYYVCRDVKRRRLAKLTPVPTTSNSLVYKVAANEIPSSHVGRRQSLMQGVSVIQKLQEHNNKKESSSGESFSIGIDDSDESDEDDGSSEGSSTTNFRSESDNVTNGSGSYISRSNEDMTISEDNDNSNNSSSSSGNNDNDNNDDDCTQSHSQDYNNSNDDDDDYNGSPSSSHDNQKSRKNYSDLNSYDSNFEDNEDNVEYTESSNSDRH